MVGVAKMVGPGEVEVEGMRVGGGGGGGRGGKLGP